MVKLSGFSRLYVNSPQASSALFLLFSLTIFVACSSDVKPLHDAEIQKKWIRSTAEILRNLTRDYNPTVAPYAAGKPVVVNLTFEVLTFGEINEANMEFSLDMYFYQYWEDIRLAQGQDRTIPLSGAAIYSIWIPDTYIVNAKRLNIHDVVLENQMVKIYPDGMVQHMARISVTAHCRVELSLYPLDRQTCDLVLESFSLTKEALVYKWKDNETNKCTVGVFDAEMAQFDYRGVSLLETHEKLTSPGYSDVYARFVFDRRVKYMIIRSYLPSYLITLISFVGFWIPKNAVPARVALGVTTILTIVYFLSAVDSQMPRVSYMKAIDYHMFVSFGFIFASLLEYVIALNIPMKLDPVCIHEKNECHENRAAEEVERQPTDVGQDKRHQQDFELRCRGKKSSGSYDVTPSKIDVTNHCFLCSYLTLKKNNGIHKVHPLDKFSRVLFPLGYLILVIVYWVVYMVMNEQNTEPNKGHVLC